MFGACVTCQEAGGPACVECDEFGGCTTCGGYFDDFFICNSCTDFGAECTACNNVDFCTTCTSPNVIHEGYCVPCSEAYTGGCETCDELNCLTCDSATEFVDETGNCADCGSYIGDCIECTLETKCTECIDPKVAVNGTCMTCTEAFGPQCETCTELTCMICDGYNATPDWCVTCESGFGPYCLLCDEVSNCTECIEPYVARNGTCMTCTEAFGPACADCTTPRTPWPPSLPARHSEFPLPPCARRCTATRRRRTVAS